MSAASINRLGWACLALITAMLLLSFPLHCFRMAATVAAGSATAGAGLGTAMAMVTRTRRPVAIYAWLAACGLTFLPLLFAWPPGDSFDVTLWRGAPDILSNYFEFMRGGVFLLAMPFPFARFGQHGPDPLPTDKSEPAA